MKKFLRLLNNHYREIATIIGFIFVLLLLKYCNPKDTDIEINYKQVDSLQIIIDRLEIELYKRDIKIDSLYNNKKIINNTYETTIKNYSNPTVVSDDSISRYISNKLQNRK